MSMYHSYNKDNQSLREAVYKEYKRKCFYCGLLIPQIRQMQIDHIIPTNKPQVRDEKVAEYLSELEKDGFVVDSIENYLPTCSGCNRSKSNRLFNASNLRFYHEQARMHVPGIIKLIENEKTTNGFSYEPVDESLWQSLDFAYQRDISYAIMGYRLTSADVSSCPRFPQVEQVCNQLNIVDYAMIQGETGCGKSITLFQAGYYFASKGWQVYIYNGFNSLESVELPNNTENSLYLIDDAQQYSEHMIHNICEQSRQNRKVLLAKTIADQMMSEDVILTNEDAVNILYNNFLKRKSEIWPIVRKCDGRVGVGMDDIPIEQRLESARAAKTPWQFTYILRGGWNRMHDLYSSIRKSNDRDLLAATIAAFQILNLDKAVNLDYINSLYIQNYPEHHWGTKDIKYLVDKKIVLSDDEIRIVHLESANVIVSLFFDCEKTEKQNALISVIEEEFRKQRVSPLGIVWLCNGCRYSSRYYFSAEEIFITENIKTYVNEQIDYLQSSEEIRNMMYLIEKILAYSKRKTEDMILVKTHENTLVDLINNADGISAWGFKELLNTIYNNDKDYHRLFCKKIAWKQLMQRMMQDDSPVFYSWGGLFNRGLMFLGKNEITYYRASMYELMSFFVKKTTVDNIEQTTYFLCSVAFICYDKIPDLIALLSEKYRAFFEKDMAKAIHIFDFDLLSLCGVEPLWNHKPTDGERRTAHTIIQAIPTDKLAIVVSESRMREWYSIEEVLLLIHVYNKKKYADVIRNVDLNKLSSCVSNSWNRSHEICMILIHLHCAGQKIAKAFLKMNLSHIQCFYSVMVAIDAETAIKEYLEHGVPLDLFTGKEWNHSLSALKALNRTDKVFLRSFLNRNVNQIADMYNHINALDFEDRAPLDILKLIKETDEEIYKIIVELIDKPNVKEKWDRNCGISSRRRKGIYRRADEFFKMLII